ncbi:MAG: ABC transporter permease [Candidatus Hodarchaeales archaeon]|jgi:ABC-2 type transport system permease protein
MNVSFYSTQGSSQMLYLVIKNLKTMIRDRTQLIWLLGYPILFMSLLPLAYGKEVLKIMGPGLLVLGPIVIISQLASHFAEEKELGTLQRLTTTPVSRFTILGAGLFSQLIVGAIQIVILLVVAVSFGAYFHPDVNILLLYITLLLVTFTSLGFALILASFVKNSSSAGGLAWFIILPLQFLGGTFSDEPIVDFLPTSLAVETMKSIMLFGDASFDVIGLNLILILIWGIIGVIIGVVLFQRKTAIL